MAVRLGRDSARYKKLKAILRREGRDCWLCGMVIDYGPDSLDPFTVDHVLPLSTHPEMAEEYANLDAAHESCNKSRGANTASGALGHGPPLW